MSLPDIEKALDTKATTLRVFELVQRQFRCQLEKQYQPDEVSRRMEPFEKILKLLEQWQRFTGTVHTVMETFGAGRAEIASELTRTGAPELDHALVLFNRTHLSMYKAFQRRRRGAPAQQRTGLRLVHGGVR